MRTMIAATVLLLASSGCFNPSEAAETQTEATNGSGTDGESESSGTAAGSESSGTAADGSTGAGADPCPQYCTLVSDHCAGDQAQYSGQGACEAVCAAIPPGSEDDQLGNTVGCRTYHAINAAEDPGTHCVHAGPAGGGVCGGNCESFCSLALELCTDDLAVWTDVESCLTDCGQFPDDVPFSETQVSGDSLACRLYHLTVAALQPDPHCSHIALVSETCGG